ncbi:MAG: DUF86 domain-containing protein [Paracoccaceae bacterium]|nr:DUF86 domain-containing protein [Paracoccaceae bacterium]
MLHDIVTDCQRIFENTAHLQKSEWLASGWDQDAVERNIERIAEALNKIRDHNPEFVPRIPGYHQIRGMRNKIVHQYHAVNLDIVWDSILKDIPVLHEAASELLAELDPQQDQIEDYEPPQPTPFDDDGFDENAKGW